jgi:predicted dehydrogenase
MNKRSLVIGMGIGQLYKTVLTDLGHEVVTVDRDPSKGADFESVDVAIITHGAFDTVHICTPNFTHFDIATKVAKHAKIVFIEKPGVSTSRIWETLVKTFPNTQFMMVKNNQWRDNIVDLIKLTEKSKSIEIRWHNKDRVPNPGTWFTTKKLSFGGVSRDLMPHLLSVFMVLEPYYKTATPTLRVATQDWTLKDVADTDYGTVNADGTYDVDDNCCLGFVCNNRVWMLSANWRTLQEDDRAIVFTMQDDSQVRVELGLCPEQAYQTMIQDALLSYYESTFWNKQLTQDLWIHEQIENI